jgi:hypothetical protein
MPNKAKSTTRIPWEPQKRTVSYSEHQETRDWLEFGKVIQGNFKALCIKKYVVDNGFEEFTFMPMVSYDARRFGPRIQVAIVDQNLPYQVYAAFDIVKKKNSNLKKFSDYFRML